MPACLERLLPALGHGAPDVAVGRVVERALVALAGAVVLAVEQAPHTSVLQGGGHSYVTSALEGDTTPKCRMDSRYALW